MQLINFYCEVDLLSNNYDEHEVAILIHVGDSKLIFYIS